MLRKPQVRSDARQHPERAGGFKQGGEHDFSPVEQ